MTLLETLAVLVLLSTVATVAIGVLPSVGTATQQRVAILDLRASLERARTLATHGTGSEFRVRTDAAEPIGSDVPLVVPTLPSGWSARVLDIATGEEERSLRFDSRGRSIDVRIELLRSGEDIPAFVFRVLGLTGQWVGVGDES
ncbi:MAG: hypothetical protein RLN60_05805 [Phycisphaerales bacterium]